MKFFGPTILNKEKKLDRKKLAGIIFSDAAKRKALNSILHPLIIREEERAVSEAVRKDQHRIVIVSAALMIEAGHFKRFKKILVVYCTKEKQIERIMKRENCSRREALQRIEAQLSTAKRKAMATIL